VDQSERRTGDIVLQGSTEAFGDSLDQRGFAGTKISPKDHHFSRLKKIAEQASNGDRLVGVMGTKLAGGAHLRRILR
jgi:hypothetical protein